MLKFLNISKKIIVSMLIVILLFFSVPIRSEAANWAENTLGKPILQFAAMLGDMGIGLLHKAVLDSTYGITDSVLLEPNNPTVTGGDLAASPDVDYDGDGEEGTENDRKSYERDSKNIIDLSGFKFDGKLLNDGVYIPNVMVCPEYIFSNRIALLDVDFVNPTTYINQEGKQITSSLQGTIASWYRAFRNIAIVAMLTILVYIGIRILIGSTAQDKAKYKERLTDWLVGLCLIFVMHFIMAGTLMVTKGITNLLSNINSNYVIQLPESEGGAVIKENITGYVRLLAQQKDIADSFVYVIMYLVMVIFTYMFLVKYIKRVLYMAFFTMISPLVAMTYALDKLADGKSQGFTMWFKEYLMNALIQPVHLVLYTVFISTATNLAKDNIIYSLVALGFMIPSEKFIKSMFRLDKGQTTGGLGDIAGGALALQGLQTLAKAGSNAASKASGSNKSSNDDKIRVNKDGTDHLKESWQNENTPQPQELDSGEDTSVREQNQNEERSHNELIDNQNGNTPEQEQQVPPVRMNGNGIDSQDGAGIDSAGGNSGEGSGETEGGASGGASGGTSGGTSGRTGGTTGGTTSGRNTRPLSNNAGSLNRNNKENKYTRRANGKPIRGMALRGAKTVGKGLWNNKKRIISGIARGFAGGAGAAIGLAAAVTTGDPSKAVSYATSGFLAGRAVGNKAVNAGANLINGSINGVQEFSGRVQNAYNEEAYGLSQADKMRKDRENEKARKQFMKNDEEVRRYKELAADMGIDNYKTVMDYAWDYKVAGITDDDKIAKGLKLENKYSDTEGMSHEKMIGVIQASKNMSEDTILDDKKRHAFEESLTAKLGGNKESAAQVMELAAESVDQGDYYRMKKNEERSVIETAQRERNRQEADRRTQEESRRRQEEMLENARKTQREVERRESNDSSRKGYKSNRNTTFMSGAEDVHLDN